MTAKYLLLAAAAFGIAAPASAHNAWLLPSITVLSDTVQSVTVDAGTSTAPFEPNHNAMGIDGIKVWAPDGSMGKVENASRGRYRSTFDVKIDKPGTWRIGMENNGIGGTFKVNGEPWMVGRRRGPAPAPGGAARAMATPPAPSAAPAAGAPNGPQGGRPRIDPSHIVATIDEIPAGATDLVLTETTGRNEFFVTAGEPSDTLFKPTGKGLEFVPVTLPTDLVSNEPGQFRFLVDGKPAADLEVEVVPGGRRFREADQAQKLKTDAEGLLTVKWPVAGFYWINASHTDDKPSNPKAAKRRMSYTATLEVLAP
ncbi:MAG: nickel uptake transporter family protein [Novosphingobium sp. 17-62-19]|uniref:DUF4198 domain-containing protein n=1 Tax=Novosphingobium sp. 17-62-19 TaxID=1970406 RepID=UPI000BD71BC3|nr:DUF4198 domain-containing protein [Novosphingobium sp. 17-62-19]OYX95977.1 MAG: nickel uptake transporter family protein [Novosphingobium sp. 35-62-5]OZA20545.1 MAG: nickel uptake transporter family protein [Novosphingobium sp. 17-62-19]HQS97379.1 DUF4198 domain-containing protein [Novosphingobium sp.]